MVSQPYDIDSAGVGGVRWGWLGSPRAARAACGRSLPPCCWAARPRPPAAGVYGFSRGHSSSGGAAQIGRAFPACLPTPCDKNRAGAHSTRIRAGGGRLGSSHFFNCHKGSNDSRRNHDFQTDNSCILLLWLLWLWSTIRGSWISGSSLVRGCSSSANCSHNCPSWHRMRSLILSIWVATFSFPRNIKGYCFGIVYFHCVKGVFNPFFKHFCSFFCCAAWVT